MQLNPQKTYVHLADDGASTQLEGEAFWALPPEAIGAFGKGWLVSEYSFAADWSSWEMHPHGDELVYLLSGAVDFVLDEGGKKKTISLRGCGAVVVPKGVWHTAKVIEPSRMLHVTRGEGTVHRPA